MFGTTCFWSSSVIFTSSMSLYEIGSAVSLNGPCLKISKASSTDDAVTPIPSRQSDGIDFQSDCENSIQKYLKAGSLITEISFETTA